jgi:hypothetical protein
VRAKSIASFLATSAIVILSLPGAALADGNAPKGPTQRGGRELEPLTIVTQELTLRGSNGYAIEFTFEDHQKLEVEASKINSRTGAISNVSYELTVPRDPGSDDIDARIGNLGRIDLHFVPEKLVKGEPICEGGHLTTEKGHYVGSISFRGEGGFTSAAAHRVAGTVERETITSCSPAKTVTDSKTEQMEAESVDKLEKEEAAKQAEERHELQLIAVLDGGKVAFSAVRIEPTTKGEPMVDTDLVVVAKRDNGRIKETSLLGQLEKGPGILEAPNTLDPSGEAIVTPASPPFSGSGTFKSASGNAKNWTGDLKVDLPGIGTVPLAGHRAKAIFCTSECMKSPFSREATEGPTLR